MITPTAIAVFGSSEPRDGEPAFELALEVGTRLAAAGYAVLTGGYGGVMEGASRGAREAGGRTIGVTCSIFDRRPNAWLDESVATEDLHERTRELIDRAAGFVVLPGKAGTLAELSFLWALHRAGCLDGHPVVLLGSPWPRLLRYLLEGGLLDRSEYDMADIVETPDQMVRTLARRLPAAGGIP